MTTLPPGLLDEPVPLRPSDRPTVERLLPYLRSVLELDGEVDVTRFPGGRANLTYLVRGGGRELVVRRPPYGELPPGAHDMVREHRAIDALAPVLEFVPPPVHLCTDPAVLGVPFLVMERVRGFVLRDHWPGELGDRGDLRRRIGESFLDAVVRLHAVRAEEVGLTDLGRPEGFMARQVHRWHRRWQATGDRHRIGADVFAWLERQEPPDQRPAIIHNDLKLDNAMLAPDDTGRIVAILDWDMCTLGDPLYDLGTMLAYWAEPTDHPARFGGRLPPTALPGFPSRAELVARYAEGTGRDVSAVSYYEIFGLARVAVICQQLLERFREGMADDTRLRVYESQVPALWADARARIEQQEGATDG